MKKEKKSDEKEELVNENTNENEAIINETEDCCETCDTASDKEALELKSQLEQKSKQLEECMSMLQRNAAEFDNYKKRTQKEKESLYLDASINTVNAFLPVVDNLERALKAAENMEPNPLKDGMEMVMRQLKECLEKLGVEPIIAVENNFNPDLHNAVMHVEDESVGESMVIEEFQKGYLMKGKVVRHSMVKVAN